VWQWSVTACFPGPRNPFAHNGRETTRKVASERAKETAPRMKAFYPVNPRRSRCIAEDEHDGQQG
jgi:hypothetical protein